MLLDKGADIYKCDSLGQSPVREDFEYGHTEKVKILLGRGADFNKCDDQGHLPLQTARANYKKKERCYKSVKKTVISVIKEVMKAYKHGYIEIVKIYCQTDEQAVKNVTRMVNHLQ